MTPDKLIEIFKLHQRVYSPSNIKYIVYIHGAKSNEGVPRLILIGNNYTEQNDNTQTVFIKTSCNPNLTNEDIIKILSCDNIDILDMVNMVNNLEKYNIPTELWEKIISPR
jgi:hypothetical protein